ncbi:hypothetical protein HWV62_35969, partial [Athelia sp. TMB]
MSNTSPPKIRVFTKGSGGPMAIGKNHASWFICHAKPYGMRAKRASFGLNYIKGPNSFLPPSPETGHLRFVVSDYMDVLQNELLPLRDKDGNSAIKVLAEKVDGNPIVECQKRDWKTKLPKGLSHKEECKLLEEGKDYE